MRHLWLGGDRRVADGDVVTGQTLARDLGAWVCFEDEAGQSLRSPKGLGEADYTRLLCAVYTELRAPLILVWDNLNHPVSATMRRFVDDHDWLTVVQLPSYAPELNPTEGVWSHVKRGLGNLAACAIDQQPRVHDAFRHRGQAVLLNLGHARPSA